MDRTAEMSSLPLDFDGSLDPAGLPEITLGSHSLISAFDQSPQTMSRSNTGRISPLRGRTMKEYDQQVSELKKENFSLKMRIYYMEERMQQRYGDGQDVFKTNIELQVEIENLKKDLLDKQVLVQKAAMAMKTLTDDHEHTVETMKNRVLAEHQAEMDRLRDQAENASKDCEKYRKEAEESSKKLETLKQSLDDALFDLNSANKAKDDFANKVKRTEFEVQTLTAQLKLLEQSRSEQDKERSMLIQRQRDLEQQISDSRKDVHRKDRDIMNLSTLLNNESHLDTKSILQPEHLKDELEDMREALQRKDHKVQELEDLLKHKGHVVEKLEEALKTLRSEKSAVEKTSEDKANELDEKSQILAKYKRSIEGLVKSLRDKDKEGKMYQDRLEESQKEVEKLRESVRKAELERTEVVTSSTESEAAIKRLEAQLEDLNAMSENLIKSLGKKEGELAGFQEQLKRAMEALNKSEEALEALQAQLSAERTDFENQLREQALKYQKMLESKLEPKNEMEQLRKQVDDLQKLISTQNSELLAFAKDKIEMADVKNRLSSRELEMKKLSDDHNKEILNLTKELEVLKAELKNSDKTIQTPAASIIWDNRQYHETVHTHQVYGTGNFTRLDVLDDPSELLQDVKGIMDMLREEIAMLSRFHGLPDQNNTRDEQDAFSRDMASIQNIHKRLEDLLEKNSQLHHAVLSHLKQDNRQSDSPDSNSCQDGGYSLDSPVRDVAAKPSKKNECLVSRSESSSTIGSGPLPSSPAFNHSVGIETYPDVLDKSLQTGLSICRTDNWAQTSPGRTENSHHYQAHDPRHRVPENQRQDSESTITKADKVSRQDNSNHNISCGNDAASRTEESLEDYHNFSHGISFDDYYFEFSRPDRASAVLKSDSKERRSLPHSRNSQLSHQHESLAQSPKDATAHAFEDFHASNNGPRTQTASDGDEPDGNGYPQSSGQETVQVFDQGETTSGRHTGQDLRGGGDHAATPVGRGKPRAALDHQEKGMSRPKLGSATRSDPEQMDFVDAVEEHGFDHNGRRCSWAEELEQYRVIGDQLDVHSELKRDQFLKSVLDMSVRELRSLVAKQYSDLQDVRRYIQLHIHTAALSDPSVDAGQEETSTSVVQNTSQEKNVTLRASSSRPGKLKATTSFKHLGGACMGSSFEGAPHEGSAVLHDSTTAPAAKCLSEADKENVRELLAQVQELKGQLEATENTVRLLSKRNKVYLSKLEAAGLSTATMSRSNSESCLREEARTGRWRASSMENLSHTCSDQDNGHNDGSNLSEASLKEKETGLAQKRKPVLSRPHSSTPEPDDSDVQNNSRPSHMESLKSSAEKARSNYPFSQGCSLNFTSVSSVIANVEDSTQAQSVTGSSSTVTMELDKTLQNNVNHVQQTKVGKPAFHPGTMAPAQCLSPIEQEQKMSSAAHKMAVSGNAEAGQSQSKTEMSLFDQSLCPDVTYSSILDFTSLLRSSSLLDKTADGEENKSWTNSSVAQLKLKLEHLEQVNATLKQEIAVIEALHSSGGMQTSLVDEGPRKPERRLTLTEKELLREHLIEIRKLRQRLEKLDVTNDPEQLLIFQSHTYQRITHQENMISMLQTQMADKEDQWQREMAETQHKLSREKAVVVEKLEQTISQLQSKILSQKDKIRELDNLVKHLQEDLATEQEAKVEKEEELRKTSFEKSSLEEDLVKREREFLDLEKAMFKLEMAKESSESECKKMRVVVEESEKDRKQLKKEVEEYKECSICLKEVIEKREKSLQETIQTAQKLNAAKKELERKLAERDDRLKSLEREAAELKRQMHENEEGLESELRRLRKVLDEKEQMWCNAESDYKVQLVKLGEEKKFMKADMDYERKTFNDHMEQLRQQNSSLGEHVDHLKTRVQALSDLDDRVDQLSSALEVKSRCESELRAQVQALTMDVREAEDRLRDSQEKAERLGEEKRQMEECLKERHEKVKKREKQLHHLLNQQKKLDLAYVKLKYTLTEKEELVQSLQRRMHLCEITLNCSSQEEKEDTMRELLKELLATQRQVEELLSRIEKNTPDTKAGSNTVITSSTTSVVTSVSSSMTSSSLGKSTYKTGMSPDIVSSSDDSEGTGFKLNAGCSPIRASPGNSPESRKMYAESTVPLPLASDYVPLPTGAGRVDIHGLCAVFKLQAHEKLRKETNESLVTLSGLEARLNDRLRSYKSKAISESVDYSTMRESSLACHNLRVCLNEAASLIAAAWITELPPVDSMGHFYDPNLAEQNDYLRHELSSTLSRMDVLNHTVKEQQGRLNASSERQKSWEASLYKQLTKTTKDLEAAKENIESYSLAGLPLQPRRHHSYRHQPSPQKSPLKKHEETF